jgi:hypothetical protein
MLFFQHDKGRWVIESNKPWPIDERGVNFGAVPTYSVDDIVTVYWDAQRRMFVPVKDLTLKVVPCILTEDLNSGSFATANLLIGSSRSTAGDEVIVYDIPTFITADMRLISGTKLRILWDSLISKWVLLTTSNCEVDQESSSSASSISTSSG